VQQDTARGEALITITLTRKITTVTEHSISEEAFEKWKSSKGAKPIDGSCSPDFKIISREQSYEMIKAKDSKGVVTLV
jgi:hypothetical protein